MRWCGVRLSGWMFVWLLSSCSVSLCRAQATPARSLAAALTSLASRAATAFVGQVTAIQRQGGVVVVRFRVDEAVYGTADGVYELREWAGLWSEGQVRYAIGERALVFLHAASAGGVATPVDGGEGVLPLLVQGIGVTPLLDIRRLGAAVLRTMGTPLPGEADGAISLAEAEALARSVLGSSVRQQGTPREPIRRPLPGWGVERQGRPGEMPDAVAGAGSPELPATAMRGDADSGEVLHAPR